MKDGKVFSTLKTTARNAGQELITIPQASEQSKICTLILISAIMLSCKAFPLETEKNFQKLSYNGKDNKVTLQDFLGRSSTSGKVCRILPVAYPGGNEIVAMLWEWFYGFCDAIEKEYLRSIHISLHQSENANLTASETITKSYTMTYEYGSDIAIRLTESHDGISEEKTLAVFKGEVEDFLHVILEQLHEARPEGSMIAPRYTIRAALQYTHNCPARYDVPGFGKGTSEVRAIIRKSRNQDGLKVDSHVHSFGIGCSDNQVQSLENASESLQDSASMAKDSDHTQASSSSLPETQKQFDGIAHDSRSSTNRLTQLLPSSDQNILQFPHSNQPHTNRQSPLACESSEAGDDEAHKHHEETLRYLREHTSGSSVVLNSVAQALQIEPGKAYEVLGELQETGALTITSRNGMRISGSRTINFSLAVNGADLTESVSESPISASYRNANGKARTTKGQMLPPRRTTTPQPKDSSGSTLARVKGSANDTNTDSISPSQTSETASTNSHFPLTPAQYNLRGRKRRAQTDTPESQLGSLKKTSHASFQNFTS